MSCVKDEKLMVAVNGDAMVNKVRYVALSQLEALETLSARSGGLNPEADRDAARLLSAQNYLSEFLAEKL